MTDDDGTRDSTDNGTDRDPVEFDRATPAAEWAIAIVGAVLACAIIGYLAVEGLRGSDDPPLLSITLVDIVPGSAGNIVQAEIANSGGRAAANVQVIGRLTVDGAVVEEVDAQLDYVPAKATRRFALVFGRDPTTGRLEISPAGYSGP